MRMYMYIQHTPPHCVNTCTCTCTTQSCSVTAYLEPLSLSEHFRVIHCLPGTRPTTKQTLLICFKLQLVHLVMAGVEGGREGGREFGQ